MPDNKKSTVNKLNTAPFKAEASTTSTAKPVVDLNFAVTPEQKKLVAKNRRQRELEDKPQSWDVKKDYVGLGINEPGLQESISPIDFIIPNPGQIKTAANLVKSSAKTLPKVMSGTDNITSQQMGFINTKGALQKYPKGKLTQEEINAFKNSDYYKFVTKNHLEDVKKYGDSWKLPNYAEESLQKAIETGNRNEINKVLYGGRNWGTSDYIIAGLAGTAYPGYAGIMGLAFSPPVVKNKVLNAAGITSKPGVLSSRDTTINITNRPMDFAKVNQTANGQMILGGEFIEDTNNTVRKAKDWLTATDTYSDKEYSSKDIQSFYGIENGKFKVGKASDFKSNTEIVPRRFGATNINQAILNEGAMRLLDKEGNLIYQNTPNTGKFILYSPSTKEAEFNYITSGKSGVDKVNKFLKMNKDAQYIHLDNGRYEFYGLNPEGLSDQDFRDYYQQDLEREGNPGYNIILKSKGGLIKKYQEGGDDNKNINNKKPVNNKLNVTGLFDFPKTRQEAEAREEYKRLKINPNKINFNTEKSIPNLLAEGLINNYPERYGNFTADQFESMLDSIAQVETKDENIKQTGGGPGRGFYQLETKTIPTAIKRYNNYKKVLKEQQNIDLPEIKKPANNDARKLSKEEQGALSLANMSSAYKVKLDKNKNAVPLDPTRTMESWITYHWAGKNKYKEDRQKHWNETFPEATRPLPKKTTKKPKQKLSEGGKITKFGLSDKFNEIFKSEYSKGGYNLDKKASKLKDSFKPKFHTVDKNVPKSKSTDFEMYMRNYQYGGRLIPTSDRPIFDLKYRDGGKTKVYTNKKEFDKANQAYTDSLNLYNAGVEKINFGKRFPQASNETLNKIEDIIDKKYPVSSSRGGFGSNMIAATGWETMGARSAKRGVPQYTKPTTKPIYQPKVESTKPEFQDRIDNPAKYDKLAIKNDDGTKSTIKMMSFESDGKYYASPTIFNENGKLIEYPMDQAWKKALDTGNYKQFNSEKEAQDYANNGYKKGTPLEDYKFPTESKQEIPKPIIQEPINKKQINSKKDKRTYSAAKMLEILNKPTGYINEGMGKGRQEIKKSNGGWLDKI